MLKQKFIQPFAKAFLKSKSQILHYKENREILSMAPQQFQCDQLERAYV